MSLCGVGIDVTDIGRIARLVERGGARFTGRWFTSAEVAECQLSDSPATEFARRFAAKEAVWKSLDLSSSGPVPWRSIAILCPSGEPVVKLAGDVAVAARAFDVTDISVAITVDDEGRAIAIAIADRRADCGLAAPDPHAVRGVPLPPGSPNPTSRGVRAGSCSPASQSRHSPWR